MARVDYDLLGKQARALVEDVPHLTANLANLSALIYDALDDVNWVGFYLLQGDRLILGPFQGKVACVELPYGKGVCWAAVMNDSTVVVPDVNLFQGHIACDSASNSELVIPLLINNVAVGVLDIDSPLYNRFELEEEETFLEIAKLISDKLAAE